MEYMDTGALTIQQAAKILGVTEIHLRKLLSENIIPSFNIARGKVRKAIRIQRKDIIKFMKKGGINDSISI